MLRPMLKYQRQFMVLLAVAFAASLLGCEGLQDPPEKKTFEPKPPPPPEPPEPVDITGFLPKKVPLPTLPKGAGEMDADAPEELNFTQSGLYYRILRKSDGKKPTEADRVLVHYVGTLESGKQFDSSYERGKPAEFALKQIIVGWIEGLQLVGVGGMIELEIPYQLAYGKPGLQPMIPPKANLHFIVELVEIVEHTNSRAGEP